MIYDASNALGATVYDLDTGAKIAQVLSVDTDTAELECAHQPVRVKPNSDEIDTFKVCFSMIYPIFGLERRPQLFHCYGRQS